MKKKLIILIIALNVSVMSFAQSGLNLGASIGFPYQNFDGYDYSFAFSADINYLFEVSTAFDIGLATGYGQAFGEDYYRGFQTFEIPDYQFVPVALAARFGTGRLVFGADIGYAFSVSSAKDGFNRDYYSGGFYWKPMFGFNLNEKLQLNVSYTGISEDYFYYSCVNLGATININ